MRIADEIAAQIHFKVRTGEMANYLEIELGGNVYLQSYGTIIAMRTSEGTILLDESSWDYSRTTGKHRNEFLMETKKETQKKITSGKYQLVNLNA